MTQEEKCILLQDITARLPYGVKAILSEYHIDEFPYNGKYCDKVINLGICGSTINLLNHIEKYGVKPYLRSIHKLAKEELEELEFITDGDYVDYCNKHHIDYRNLIPKGLALEAPEGMYI